MVFTLENLLGLRRSLIPCLQPRVVRMTPLWKDLPPFPPGGASTPSNSPNHIGLFGETEGFVPPKFEERFPETTFHSDPIRSLPHMFPTSSSFRCPKIPLIIILAAPPSQPRDLQLGKPWNDIFSPLRSRLFLGFSSSPVPCFRR